MWLATIIQNSKLKNQNLNKMFDFSIVTNWFHNLLSVTCGLGDFWTILIECILVGVCILAGYAILAII